MTFDKRSLVEEICKLGEDLNSDLIIPSLDKPFTDAPFILFYLNIASVETNKAMRYVGRVYKNFCKSEVTTIGYTSEEILAKFLMYKNGYLNDLEE